MRKKHALTSTVISGFAPDRREIERVTIKDIPYRANGRMAQPELVLKNALIQIYIIPNKCAKILKRKMLFERS